jgi:DNA-binding MurR/RpiR family transcriptional regulator
VPNQSDVISRISEKYPQLSTTARIIANYLQQHPLAVLSMSVADIASATHTSKATVSRFFRQLGYASHQDARQALTTLRQHGLPLQSNNPYSSQSDIEVQNVKRTLDELPQSQLNDIADLLATSPRITIIGYRNSYPMALHCRQQLKQIRSTVRLLPQPGQSLSEDLHDIGDNEVILLMGFRRRPQGFAKLVAALKNYTTILITDPSGQIYNDKVTHLIVCQLGQDFPFDSYAAPMSVISILCNKTYCVLGDQATVRARSISALYQELNELDNE